MMLCGPPEYSKGPQLKTACLGQQTVLVDGHHSEATEKGLTQPCSQ